MKISLLINMKMPTIVGIFIYISRDIFMPISVDSFSEGRKPRFDRVTSDELFSKKEFAIVSNLRFVSRTNFMLS